MILLSVDSSGKSAAVAVTRQGQLLAESFENNGFTHSETLLPLVQRTLQQAGIQIDQVDGFAVTNGPGSFTGLRIGCAMIKGLAGDKPCFPVPTLWALAHMAQKDGIIIPMMDARRNQTYTATFQMKEGRIHQLQEDRAIDVMQVEKEVLSYLSQGQRVTVVGDGAYLLSENVASKVEIPAHSLICGSAVARAAQHVEAVSAASLGLRYLRLSQAEREKLEKNGGKSV